jgi:hypothetical protein
MITHKREAIEARGYESTGIVQDTMPGYGRIRRALIDLNLAHESLTAFRMEDGRWEIFKTPDAKTGFKDEPLLP